MTEWFQCRSSGSIDVLGRGKNIAPPIKLMGTMICLLAAGCGGGGSGNSSGSGSGAGTAAGSSASAAASVQIVSQPVNLTVTDGQAASFSVTASGKEPLTYQWKMGSEVQAGATAATFSIPQTIYTYHNNTSYSVVVTDASGSQVASQAATLTITPLPPSLTESPLSRQISPGSTATFGAAATGSLPLTYQWNVNGAAISGATSPSYTTGANSYPQNNGDAYTVTVTNGAGQSITSAAAALTVAEAAVTPVISVDVSKADAAAAHQVTYRRGGVRTFDLQNAPATIAGQVQGDTSSAALNFFNGTLELNSTADAPFFTYTAPNLAVSVSGTAPLEQTFGLLDSSLQKVVQVSGVPEVFPTLDPGYEPICNGMGNNYLLPPPGASMQVVQNAVEAFIGSVSPSVPGAIWIGTQEPSHTLGYPVAYDNGAGCTNVPSADLSAAVENNIQRYIAYWTPIAQYLRANQILSGGIQLNSGNLGFYVTSATEIISAQMPLDYYTIQDYTPSAAVDQALYSAYQKFQQNPSYLNVKVIIDRYGIALGTPDYTAATSINDFLQDEAQLMPYADMMYGYDVETDGIAPAGSLLPQVLQWLQAAPAPLRPLTSTTSDLQAFALVQKGPPQRAYIAIWNVSPTSASYATSVTFNGMNAFSSAASLTVLHGSGNSISALANSGIAINGTTISGLALNVNEFLLISVADPGASTAQAPASKIR